MALKRTGFLTALALSLTACSSGGDVAGGAGASLQVLRSVISGKSASVASVKNAPRAEIEKVGKPVLFVEIPAWGTDALLLQSSTRGDVINWAATDATVFTLRDGVLLQTRGLRTDLMSANVPKAAQILAGGTYKRGYYPLSENDQAPRIEVTCTARPDGTERITIHGRSHATHRVAETCANGATKFTNHYWFEGGRIRQSEEWAGPDMGMLRFARVVD